MIQLMSLNQITKLKDIIEISFHGKVNLHELGPDHT